MIKGVIVYSSEVDRWMFMGENELCFNLRCGELLEIKMFSRYRSCRLEYDGDWYVIFKGISFILLHSFIYNVRCD